MRANWSGVHFPANLEQTQSRLFAANRGEHVEQHIDPFASDATADVKEKRRSRSRGAHCLVDRREFARDAVGRHDEPRRLDQSARLDFGADGLGGAKDHRCPLHAG